MIKKVFVWIPFAVAVLLSVCLLVYYLLQTCGYSCTAGVRIAATVLITITFGVFDWFIYVLTLDMYKDITKENK